jgi:RES domain-containing protein
MPLRRRALRDLQAKVFEGTVYRHLSTQYASLDTSGSIKAGGRWNPRGEFTALYTALTEETALAELQRLAERQALSLDDLAPRDMAAIAVVISKVLDLTDKEILAQLGITEDEIVRNDVSLCHEISRVAQRIGFEAILAPSATRRGTVLVVYTERLLGSSKLEVTDRKRIL